MVEKSDRGKLAALLFILAAPAVLMIPSQIALHQSLGVSIIAGLLYLLLGFLAHKGYKISVVVALVVWSIDCGFWIYTHRFDTSAQGFGGMFNYYVGNMEAWWEFIKLFIILGIPFFSGTRTDQARVAEIMDKV
jgi:hypothetical protein